MRRWSLALAALWAGAATAQEVTVINDSPAFPEGPAIIDGALYYAQYGANVVTRWDGEKNQNIWTGESCGPSAVIPFQGDLLVTCYDSNLIARVNPDGETVYKIDADTEGALFVGPNDFSSDGQGGVFMTASGPWESAPIAGKIYHIGEDGEARPVADDLHYANGLVYRAEDGRLYVNESEAARVISFAVGEDGALSDRRLFLRVGQVDPGSGPYAYPDGLKIGPDGNFYIGQYSSGRIVVASPTGELVRVLEVPAAAAPNLTFSEDGSTAFVMAVEQTDAPPYLGKVLALPLE